MKKTKETAFYLVDNGSLRPESWINLKKVAQKLSEKTAFQIIPASVLHSTKIPEEKLNGEKAELFISAAKKEIEQGVKEHIILPYFIGPTAAVKDYLPKKFTKEISSKNPEQKLKILACLGETDEGQIQIAKALKNELEKEENLLTGSSISLVDHGSPKKEVTEVRNQITKKLEQLFEDKMSITACSMERREGEEYDFNEPLLENHLRNPDFKNTTVHISQLFLSPGRHAGENGDIAEICHNASQQIQGLKTIRTNPIGDRPEIENLLLRSLFGM